jgi:hypothetical protein
MLLSLVSESRQVSPTSAAYYAFDVKNAAIGIAPFAPRASIEEIEALLRRGIQSEINTFKKKHGMPNMIIADTIKDCPLVPALES